jgi:hypothetical protein
VLPSRDMMRLGGAILTTTDSLICRCSESINDDDDEDDFLAKKTEQTKSNVRGMNKRIQERKNNTNGKACRVLETKEVEVLGRIVACLFVCLLRRD